MFFIKNEEKNIFSQTLNSTQLNYVKEVEKMFPLKKEIFLLSGGGSGGREGRRKAKNVKNKVRSCLF